MTEKYNTSYFVTNPYIQSRHLNPGAVLQVCWKPNRRCHFLHLGNGSFEVLLSEKSKLAVGDTFYCDLFFVGMPTYFNNLIHLKSDPVQYVIGKRGGVTEVSVISTEGESPSVALAKAFDIHQYLAQQLSVKPVVPSTEGLSRGVVPLHQVLLNAISIGLLEYDGHQLVFAADRPERECGFFAHTLHSHYTFASWSDIDSIIVRLKHNGTMVKTLRQSRSFSPFDRSDLREQIFQQLFLDC